MVIPALVLLVVGLFYEAHLQSLPSWAKPWALEAILVPLVIIAWILIRKVLLRCSHEHNLICPRCGVALGFYYATLKKTGTCGKCGEIICATA
jgi:ribosomal protein S27AE